MAHQLCCPSNGGRGNGRCVLRKHYARLTEKDVNALPLEKSGIPAPVSEKVDIGCDLFAENLFF